MSLKKIVNVIHSLQAKLICSDNQYGILSIIDINGYSLKSSGRATRWSTRLKLPYSTNLGNTEGLHGKAYHLTRNAISHSYHKLWESQKRLCCTVSSIMSIRFQIKTQIISSTASLLFLLLTPIFLLSIHIHSLVSGN